MRDVAVLSLFDRLNYGNSLQRCAILRGLRRRGLRPVFLNVRPHPVLGGLHERMGWEPWQASRAGRTAEFEGRQGVEGVRLHTRGLADAVGRRFGVCVIGSDQVWNPLYGLGALDDGVACLRGLDAARKVALCPSFGVRLEDMPAAARDRYARDLSDFSRISVREDEGARIVRALTGREAAVLMDPTMSVEAQEWRTAGDYAVAEELRARLAGDKDGYVLVYHLGRGSASLSSAVLELARVRRLAVVDLADSALALGGLGPDAFLALVDLAAYVVTDSFHGAVFSLLLHTDFAIVPRLEQGMCDMSSRQDTLCRAFGCADRLWRGTGHPLPGTHVEWGAVDSRLRGERARFDAYLDGELARVGLL